MKGTLWLVVALWLTCNAAAFTTDPLSCRVCSWHLTCKQLCESAGQECQKPWKEGPDDTICRITYPRPTPDARTLQGRMVHSEVTYLVHKDVLSDLLHRYSQVKRIRLHGGSLGMPGFGELDALALQHSISLCFPRMSLAWRWFTGQRLAPSSTVCCHQECHWEELFKRTQMPTLQELFAKAVDANEAALSKHSPCGLSNTVAGIQLGGVRLVMSDTPHGYPEAQAAAVHSASGATAVPQAGHGASGTANEQQGEVGPDAVEGGEAAGGSQAEVGDMVGMAGDVAASVWYGIGHEQLAMRAQARGRAQAQQPEGGSSQNEPDSQAQYSQEPHEEAQQQQQQQQDDRYSYLKAATRHHNHVADRLQAMLQGQLDMTLEGLLLGLAWLLAPGLLIAYEAMAVAATSPWMAVYVCVVATLRTIAEWRAVWLAATTRHGSVRDKVLGAVSGVLIMAIVVVMVAGFVTSWLPLLTPPLSSAVLWTHMLAMPLVAAWFMYAVWGVQAGRGTGIGAASWALLGGGSNSGSHHQHGSGHNHRQRGSNSHGSASRQATTAQVGPTHIARTPAEAVAVVRMLGRELAPAAHGGTFMATYNRAMQQAVEGAGGGAARAIGQQAAAGAAANGAQAAPAAPQTSVAAGVGTAHLGPGTPGRTRAATSTGAPAAAGGGAVAAGSPAGGAGTTAEQAANARQSAAAAALAAIHWPPALDVPSWMEEECTVPDAFRCPITLSIMREPTQASSGVTYERSAIFQWLHIHRVDPVTHVPLKRHRLTPNLNLRHMIEGWATKRVAERALRKAASGDSEEGEARSVVGDVAGTGGGAASAAAAQTSGVDTS